MKIVVVGAGAIGGWVAAKLARSGERIMAMTSRGTLDEIVITEGRTTSKVSMGHFDGPADLVILAVKATALAGGASLARTLITPATIIVPMLNGVPWWFVGNIELESIDPGQTIAAALPYEQLIGCVVHASCSRSGAHVVVKHADKLVIGDPDGPPSERVNRVAALFQKAGLQPEVTHNVRQAIWYKLWGNATINPLSALTRATCDKILADSECRFWMLEGMRELATIGSAIGCPISESGEDRMRVTERLGAFKTSMLQDVEAHRPIELEALLGAPREIARAHHISSPALDRLYALTSLLAQGLASS